MQKVIRKHPARVNNAGFRTYGGGEPYKSDSHRDDPHRIIADRMKFYIQNARKNKLAEYEGEF